MRSHFSVRCDASFLFRSLSAVAVVPYCGGGGGLNCVYELYNQRFVVVALTVSPLFGLSGA